jgi:hypothetical protein
VIQPVIRFFSLIDRLVRIDLSVRSLRVRIFIAARYVNIHIAWPAFHVIKHVRKEHDIVTSNYTGCYSLDEITALVVKHFHLLTECDVLTPTITEKEMMDKYKFWPESTTTSPSGHHLGHYCALLPGLRTTTTKGRELDSMRTDLVRLHHQMLDYTLRHGHSFQRWKKVVNVMLEKDPGNPKIHRLRVIHLYKADYNLFLGVKWRALVHHCEDNQLLHPSMYPFLLKKW